MTLSIHKKMSMNIITSQEITILNLMLQIYQILKIKMNIKIQNKYKKKQYLTHKINTIQKVILVNIVKNKQKNISYKIKII